MRVRHVGAYNTATNDCVSRREADKTQPTRSFIGLAASLFVESMCRLESEETDLVTRVSISILAGCLWLCSPCDSLRCQPRRIRPRCIIHNF
jgi:hypothetical protein